MKIHIITFITIILLLFSLSSCKMQGGGVPDFSQSDTGGSNYDYDAASIAISEAAGTEIPPAFLEQMGLEQTKRLMNDIESGVYKLCDKIVSVLADSSVRKERIMARDNLTLSEAEKRMSAQKDDSFYKEYSDAVILNNGDKSQAIESAQQIFSEIGVL